MNNKCRKPKTGWLPGNKFMQMHLKPKSPFAAMIAEKNAELFKYAKSSGYNPDGVYILSITSEACPHCEVKLLPADIAHRRCLTCHHFLKFPTETVTDVFKVRQEAKFYSFELDIDKHPQKPIYLVFHLANKPYFIYRVHKGTLDA